MKTIPSGLTAYLAAGGNIYWRCDLYTLTLVDGVTVFRWSTASTNITIGGNTWLRAGAAAPIINRTGSSNGQLPTVDQMSLRLVGGSFLINGQSFTLAVAAGYFDGARVQIDHLMGPDLPTALSFGPVLSTYEGRVGECAPNGNEVTTPIAAESITLARPTPFIVLTPSCQYSVYDTNCGISQASFTLSGAASGTPTVKLISTASGALTAKAAGYFDLGVITFTSGALVGLSCDVESWNGTTFTLATPLAVAPAAGDTFTVFPGCHLTLADCATKFSNAGTSGHWRGYLHIPPPESGSN